MYVGYHDANNVSNLGGDQVTQLNLKNVLKINLSFCIPKYAQCWISTYFGGDQVTQLNLVLYNTIKWPYQPKHSPSYLHIIDALQNQAK